MLTNTTDNAIMAGGSICTTAIHVVEHRVGPGKAVELLVNAFEDEDDIGELVPGNYKLDASVLVFYRTASGSRVNELRSVLMVRLG